MVSLQAVPWPEVRFISIERTSVRVVIGEKVHLFEYGTKEAMEQELQRWFSHGEPETTELVNQDARAQLA